MKKFNAPLIIGSVILLLILSIIIFPEIFTDKSPYNRQTMIFTTEDGVLNIERAPYPPSKDFIMGSDEFGRDIYSFIIYGTGMTILLGFFIALGRFLIAVPIALSAGFGNSSSKTLIKQFGILFSAIPALLISIIILKLDFLSGLEKTASIVAFVVVLSITGWPKLGSLIMERVDSINQQPFIRSEIAIGKSRLKIAIENVFPHLAPELIVLFFMEIARALSMVMQMGIFSVFVGLLKIIRDTEGGISFFDVSFEPEWAGMLSTSRTMASVAPWTVLFPALAFFISVLGFNLFGEGLRNTMQKRDSLFIPKLRKLLSFNYKFRWANISRKTKILLSLIIVSIVVISLVFSLINKKDYQFSSNRYDLPIEKNVVIGTDSANKTAELLAREMKRLGIKPFDDNYLRSYDIRKSVLIADCSFIINNDNFNNIEFEKDFYFQTAVSGKFNGSVYDASMVDMFNLNEFTEFQDKFVIIDKAHYNDAAVNHFINIIVENSNAEGILLIGRVDENFDVKFANEGIDKPVINISRQVYEMIINQSDLEIAVSASVLPIEAKGTNVVGILEGAEGKLQEEAIIIGMRYNYLNDEERMLLDFNIQLMEKISKFEESNRSIIFMFIDGTMSDLLHGINGITADFPYSSSKVKVYVDLTGLNLFEFDSIKYSSVQAPFTRQYAWSLGRLIEKEFNSKRIELQELETVYFGREHYFTDSYSDNAMFFDRGIATIIIGTEEIGDKKHNVFDIGEIVLRTIKNNNY